MRKFEKVGVGFFLRDSRIKDGKVGVGGLPKLWKVGVGGVEFAEKVGVGGARKKVQSTPPRLF